MSLKIRITWNDCDIASHLSWKMKPRIQQQACRRPSSRSITGPEGNWVRVGDPNQAIFETFTTAHLNSCAISSGIIFTLIWPKSGRSQPAIHRAREPSDRLGHGGASRSPGEAMHSNLRISTPTPPGDPQPNPPEDRSAIQLTAEKLTAEQELTWIVESLTNWLPVHTGFDGRRSGTA